MKKSCKLPFYCQILKDLRKKKRYTQEYVAAQVGVQTKTYREWENGYDKGNAHVSREIGHEKLEALSDLYNVSVDYILGRSECTSIENEKISELTGLSDNAIKMLSLWKMEQEETPNSFIAMGEDVNTINLLLEHQLERTKNAEHKGCYPSWSIFHFIKQYLSSGSFKREQQDRLRICDGKDWVDVQNGDILIKNNKQYTIQKKEAINSHSGSGTNDKTIHIVNSSNSNERYVVDVDGIFSSYSKDNIFRELDKIKEYWEKKQ